MDKNFKLWSSAMPRAQCQILEDHSWIYTPKRTSNLMHRTIVPDFLLHWSGLLHILRVIFIWMYIIGQRNTRWKWSFQRIYSFMLNTGSSTDNWTPSQSKLNSLTFPHIHIFIYILRHFLHVRVDGGKTSFNSQTCFISNKLRGWETNQTTNQLASLLTPCKRVT